MSRENTARRRLAEQMMTNAPHLAFRDFTCTDIKPFVYLSGICRNYFTVEFLSQFYRQSAFAGRRRAGDYKHFLPLLHGLYSTGMFGKCQCISRNWWLAQGGAPHIIRLVLII